MGNTHSDDIIFEGYLTEESFNSTDFSQPRSVFTQRWVVLKGTSLYSFKKKNDKKPTEIIDLKLVLNVIKSNDDNKFTIISKQSKRSFIGSSNDNINQWIHYILNKISPSNYTQNAKAMSNIQNIIPINIELQGFKDETFVIYASYIKDEKMQNTFNCIKKKCYPLNIKIDF
eukprot:189279_1